MSQVDSTAVDGRGQPFAGAGCDPAEWLARLHSRTLDKIPDVSARRLLQRCWLRPTDASGWPSWELQCVDGLRLPPDVRSSYRKALEVALQEGCAALQMTEPPPQDAELHAVWIEALAALELPSTRMLLGRQARLVELTKTTAKVAVEAGWMPMVQRRLSLLEDAFARALGSRLAVVLESVEVA